METLKKRTVINKSVICLTGYKAYLLFTNLLKRPLSVDEIIELYKNDKIISKLFSKDTVRITINTLREIGCKISKPTPMTYNRYVLISHPFGVDFTKNQLLILNKILNEVLSTNDWQFVMEITDICKKIALLSNDPSVLQFFINNDPFNNIVPHILQKLIFHCEKKNKIKIKYKSPKFGSEVLDIICDRIGCENEKLYIWGYNYKYGYATYLRIDHVVDILHVYLNKDEIEIPYFQAVYKLRGHSMYTFVKNVDDEIIDISQNKLTIKSTIINEFNFMRKVLNYGSDCEVLEPKWFRTKIVKELMTVRQFYE